MGEWANVVWHPVRWKCRLIWSYGHNHHDQHHTSRSGGGRGWRGALAPREAENGRRGLVHNYQRMQQSKRPGSVRWEGKRKREMEEVRGHRWEDWGQKNRGSRVDWCIGSKVLCFPSSPLTPAVHLQTLLCMTAWLVRCRHGHRCSSVSHHAAAPHHPTTLPLTCFHLIQLHNHIT